MAASSRRAKPARQAQAQLLDVAPPDFWKRFPQPWAGLDEAGRGCLAGPVAAAAVILPADLELDGLADSKVMTVEDRDRLEPQIKARALAWGIGLAWPAEIDRVNILRASLTAMCRAVNVLKLAPVFLAVDGNQPVPLNLQQKSIVGGDGIVPAIAAASVLAKTFRDRLMRILDGRYPGYGFSGHKGYATRDHYDALHRLGPCRIHRLTFRGVAPEPARAGEQLCLPDT